MKKFFVIGHPVGHSLSPRIHSMFARQFGIEIDYRTREFAPGAFIDEMSVLRREENPAGANITVPFKRDAYDYCTELTERAKAAGAVNTMIFDGHKVRGDNTDGKGFVRDVTGRCGFALTGARVLILGAGGAARGVAAAIASEGSAKIVIANRTPEKARALALDLGLEGASFVDLAGQKFDLVVNATSASLDGSAPAVPNGIFSECALAVDLMYGKARTPFMYLASESGAKRVEDGLGMLVEQAAESFMLWFGVIPETAPVFGELRG